MKHHPDKTLVSREVSIRRNEEKKRQVQQQREINHRRIAEPNDAYNQSVAASNDHYMRDALSQVRKSDVSLPETLTRLHGTWVHNQK